MLDRLSKARQESALHPHDWEFKECTSKRLKSRSSNGFAGVPSPSIFRDVSLPYSLKRNCPAPPTIETYPAPGHVASSLLLIECFHRLRVEVEGSSKLKKCFEAHQHALSTQGEFHGCSVWRSYLSLAVKRFKLWITKIELILRHSAVYNRYGTGSHLHGASTEHYLPPIDVLLIWYCYLQDSTAYERLLASNEFSLLSEICFPWHLLPQVIDDETLEYNLSGPARRLWSNFVSLPADLVDCVDLDLDASTSAFTSPDNELLELAMRQTDCMEKIHEHKWLRSPALRGTVERAAIRYAKACTAGQPADAEQTQQIPVLGQCIDRNINDLNLDIVAQLVLQTHRAYNAAWKTFAELYNLRDEGSSSVSPPPSYAEIDDRAVEAGRAFCVSESQPCFCWVCERIRDETDEVSPITQMTALSLVSSPDDVSDKLSIASSSLSSSTEGSEPHLGLSSKQRKVIKEEIALYRAIEAQREKKALASRRL